MFHGQSTSAVVRSRIELEQARLRAWPTDSDTAISLTELPRPAHHALARLQQGLKSRGGSLLLCTGNTDRLHEAAGLDDVLHMMKALCGGCHRLVDYFADMGENGACPHCGACDLYIQWKLFWGTSGRSDAARLEQAIGRADLFVAIGTEVGLGAWAAGPLVGMAAMADVPVLALNPGGSHFIHDGLAERIGCLDDLVPTWVEALLAGADPGGVLIPKSRLSDVEDYS